MSARMPSEPPVAFLGTCGAQRPSASSGSETNGGSDSDSCTWPQPGRGADYRRLGLVAGALASVALLGVAAALAVQALRVQDSPPALDGGRAALFANHRGHGHGKSRPHKAYHGPATIVQVGPEQPAFCNGTALIKGREGCCAGRVFDLRTTSCCGTMAFYFTSLSCCDHGDGTASLYEPYAQNCCDDAAVSNVEKGVCEVERGERSCCHRMKQAHRRRRRHRRHAVHVPVAVPVQSATPLPPPSPPSLPAPPTSAAPSLSEAPAGSGGDGPVDQGSLAEV